MKILAEDNQLLSLKELVIAIQEAEPNSEIYEFKNPYEAQIAVHQGFVPDIAFLRAEMYDIGGIELARTIKSLYKNCNIIFIASNGDFYKEAFELHASGYILQPVTAKKIRFELDDLRFPIKNDLIDKLHIVTFGYFDVYKGDKQISFKYRKTKELLAYLVDRRGAMCSNIEIASVIWDDDLMFSAHKSYFYNIKSDLMKVLSMYSSDDCIKIQRSSMGINIEKVDCDFYDWLNGNPCAIKNYLGKYMHQYSWAEATHAIIERRMNVYND